MREIVDGDPQYIVAICNAANDLVSASGGIARRESDTLQNISMLRAGAFGWREAQTLFQLPYANRKPPDARHDAATCARYAKEADKKADKLCGQMCVPFEFEGNNESLAQMLWTAFRDLHIETKSWRISWQLIALSLADKAVKRKRAVGTVTTGGTASERRAWNANAAADIRKALAEHNAVHERLMQSGATYERDTELMHYAHKAAWAFNALLASYGRSRAKAMQN